MLHKIFIVSNNENNKLSIKLKVFQNIFYKSDFQLNKKSEIQKSFPKKKWIEFNYSKKK